MKKRKVVALFLLLFAIAGSFAVFPASSSAIDSINIAAQYAILVEPASGEILCEKNADVQASPASLTKIMTALIAFEKADFSEYATVTSSALADLHPESSIADLKVDEEILIDDLVKCILVASANDACNVLAEHLFGSIDAFVAEMNRRAAELGCTGTQFKNTHGLTEEGHYTTARDMYIITLEALKHQQFLEICNTASLVIPKTNKAGERTFLSTNHLISRLKSPDYVYYYAKGIKTGHTSDAGYCLVSSAEKDGVFLLSVVMGSVLDSETGKMMSFVDTKNLFEWGFSNFSHQTMLSAGDAVAELAVRLSSESDYVVLVPEESISALLPNDFNKAEVVLKKDLFKGGEVDAPVVKGDILGRVTVEYKGVEYQTVNLIALNSLKLDKMLYYSANIKEFLSQRWIIFAVLGLFALILLYVIIVVLYNRRRRDKRRKNVHYNSRRR
ncbi:MAG: D-alanyl-D-alanine carboxypeptidase [Oscillospiraceae bacterium]|jgi:D-alanyl-D-alanine carboxypeptidase (penicillin-binding protein 5/6)|nr:D-alanyl-D-alanine carboxypeptidase [Oscillospiraceae bacterium]